MKLEDFFRAFELEGYERLRGQSLYEDRNLAHVPSVITGNYVAWELSMRALVFTMQEYTLNGNKNKND